MAWLNCGLTTVYDSHTCARCGAYICVCVCLCMRAQCKGGININRGVSVTVTNTTLDVSGRECVCVCASVCVLCVCVCVREREREGEREREAARESSVRYACVHVCACRALALRPVCPALHHPLHPCQQSPQQRAARFSNPSSLHTSVRKYTLAHRSKSHSAGLLYDQSSEPQGNTGARC